MERLKKILSIFIHLIFILLIFSLAVFVSLLFAFWSNYPSGYDANSHLFRLEFISQFWPHINWVPQWAEGMPLFMRYPSIIFILLGWVSRLTHFGAQEIVTATAVLAVGLGGMGIYLFVYELTRSKWASLTASVLYLFTPSIWMTGRTGGYARAYALPFLILTLWALTVYLRDLIEDKKRRWPYVLTVLFLGISFLSHYVIGLVTFVLVGFWLLGFWGMIEPKRLFLSLIEIFIPAILLASPLWLPMLVLRTPGSELAVATIDLSKMRGIPWSFLFNFYDPNLQVSPFNLPKLTPFLYPLAGVLWLLALIVRKGKLSLNKFLGREIFLLTVIAIASLIFAKIIFPPFKIFYAGILDPIFMLYFIPIFVASLVGGLVVRTFSRHWLILLFSFLIIGGMLTWATSQYRLSEKGLEGLKKGIARRQLEKEYLLVQEVIDNPTSFNFRFGTATDADLAAWFNSLYPFIPQTRDYFAHGIVNTDDDVYKTHVLWEQAENYPETEFILDWFGIDKFVVTSANEKVQGKYETKPEIYKFLGAKDAFTAFEYPLANPILAPTNTPTALIIGKEAYDFVYRSFAQGNINSQYLLPIEGKERVDDYTLDELNDFDIIILYNYMYKKREIAFNLLAKYVRGGGGLFIESNKFVEGAGLPEPFPIFSAQEESFSGSWNLNLSSEFEGIDLTKFAPPVYQEGPWGGMIGEEVKDWGKILVSRQGKPLIVGGQLGSGRVIWSGMNLPYHVLNNHNQEEALFFRQLLAWTKGKNDLEQLRITGIIKDLTYENPGFLAKFVHPQRVELTFKQPYKGALYKGFYFPGWQAKIVLNNGTSQSQPIYKAGPRMIYIKTPAETREVIFYYQLPLVASLANVTAWLTLIFLLCLPFIKKLSLSFVKMRTDQIKAKLSVWWEKDEV